MSGSPQPPDPARPAQAMGWQPVRRARAGIRAGEALCVLGALSLLLVTVGLQWFGSVGAGGLERAGESETVGVWQALAIDRWLVIATIVAGFALLPARGLRRRPGARLILVGGIAVIAWVSALALGYRVLISPPEADRVLDLKLGAYLGLLATLAVALGALAAWRDAWEERVMSAPIRGQQAGAGGRLAPAR